MLERTFTEIAKDRILTTTTKRSLEYAYNANGNRVSKTVDNGTAVTATYYVQDASGNTLAVYEQDNAAAPKAKEFSLYGSDRVGQYYSGAGITYSFVQPDEEHIHSRQLNSRIYELKDHLGNIRATVTDKIGLYGASERIATVQSMSNYYAFGSPMPGRIVSGSSAYRYGFNGKENDNEVKGTGNQQDYGMRIYDPRLGRFFSVDPITDQYPELSPYHFAGNTPIWAIDLDGLEPLVATDYKTLSQLKKKLKLEYAINVVNSKEVHSVTVSQQYGKIFLNHTLSENGGPKQTDLTSFWGKASYCTNHPGNALVLNKINNMSYRKQNKQKMAFADIPTALIGNLAKGENRGTLNNTMLHVTGQALITTLFGKGYADLSGDIHERDHAALMTGVLKNNDAAAIDNYADIINNEWGQRWGEAIATELGITKETTWTNELTANYLNALQDKFTKSMGLKFDKAFSKDDEFVQKYTKFINENK